MRIWLNWNIYKSTLSLIESHSGLMRMHGTGHTPKRGSAPIHIWIHTRSVWTVFWKKKQNDDDDNFGESAYSWTKPIHDSYLPILGGGLMTSGGGPCMTISGGGPTGQWSMPMGGGMLGREFIGGTMSCMRGHWTPGGCNGTSCGPCGPYVNTWDKATSSKTTASEPWSYKHNSPRKQ